MYLPDIVQALPHLILSEIHEAGIIITIPSL